MTHYHYYITAGRVIDETTRIYKVGIGQSRQGKRDYNALRALAEAHNHYFHIIDQESDDFILKVMQSIPGRTISPMLVSPRDLIKALASAEEIPLAHGTLKNQHRMRLTLDLSYRVSSALSQRKWNLPA